ncbi:MAG: hypothetical protein ABH864_00335 [archaeon]
MIRKAEGEGALERLSQERREILQRHYTPETSEFIASMLDEGRMRIVDETEALRRRAENSWNGSDAFGLGAEDYQIIAELRFSAVHMPDDLKAYSKCHVVDEATGAEYLRLERFWLAEEIALLRKRLGRDPTPKEISEDARANMTAEVFRGYFCKKYANRVEEQREAI